MSTSTTEYPREREREREIGSAGVRGGGERPGGGPQQTRNELLANVLYLVTFHQMLHVLVWATNANTVFPILSYIFPGSIDGNDMWTKHVYKYDYYPMLMTNIPLLLLWFFQHSILARLGLQQKLSAYMSREAERVLYVAASTALTQFLMYGWKPMPHPVWSLEGPFALVMQTLCFLGFGWTLLSMITMANNDFFGFREALTNIPTRWVPRHLPLVYQYSRSPLWLGILVTIWSAHEMGMGRLLFAVAMTIYSLLAGRAQDRDLQHKYGREYEEYQKSVPFLVPWIKV